MKVFISWSGPEAHAVALVLQDWLPSSNSQDLWIGVSGDELLTS